MRRSFRGMKAASRIPLVWTAALLAFALAAFGIPGAQSVLSETLAARMASGPGGAPGPAWVIRLAERAPP
jgi:hypothetical protein